MDGWTHIIVYDAFGLYRIPSSNILNGILRFETQTPVVKCCTLSLWVSKIEKDSFEELKIGVYAVWISEGIVWSGLFDIE